MRKWRFSSKVPDPRILCVSYRDISMVISRCAQFEFEDVVASVDAVDVIAPAGLMAPEDADTPLQTGILTLQRLAVKTFRRLRLKLPFAVRRRVPHDLARNYEMLVVNCEAPGDLYDLAQCLTWRSRARVSVCIVQELYVSDVPKLGDLLKVLRQFDHIVVAHSGTVDALAEATGRPCHYVAFSTDTLRFSPYPENPQRVIDFYALGRRPAKTHDALVCMAQRRDWYYMYDTVPNCTVSCHVDHRRRLADMIKRSRFFLVNIALWQKSDRIGGQQPVFGCRYFEGAAAGAILVGVAPRNASFDEAFDWPDSVIPLPFDSGDIADVIAELEADPGRLERISKLNVINSLRRHDHVYRWGQILSIAGMKETKAMEHRRCELADLAASIEQTIPVSL
jgi:Glycosyl transferases group 1